MVTINYKEEGRRWDRSEINKVGERVKRKEAGSERGREEMENGG